MNETQLAERLATDFPFYAEEQLVIRAKSGQIIPFKLNKAQEYIYSRVQDQMKRTGRVRLAVLKGRQQGLSTFIGGYLYHKTICNPGSLTFIFAHDSDGSGSLYSMVKTFHYDGRYEDLKPSVGASSAKELVFDKLKSSYRVGTAGTQGLGRSKTIQNLHWSEVAYSPNCDEHAMGIMQAVPDMEGTAVFLESTSNGQGDYFHRMCMQALSGQGDFELVFIPWYWQDEYKRGVGGVNSSDDGGVQAGFEPTEFEYHLLKNFSHDGLTIEHIAWRRYKIATDFYGQEALFRREYPFTPEEAFEANDEDAFIKSHLVREARNHPYIDTDAPLIFGVDPARLGGDKFCICHRKGRNISKLYTFPPSNLEDSKARLINEIEKYRPAIVNIDCGGLGVALYDSLRALGYSNIVRKVDFGAKSVQPDRFKNKRAEMYSSMRDWLEDTPCSIQCDPRVGDRLQSEISVVKPRWGNNSQLLMQPKEEIKKELGYSPDMADAMALTFAQPVSRTATANSLYGTMKAVTKKLEWSPF